MLPSSVLLAEHVGATPDALEAFALSVNGYRWWPDTLVQQHERVAQLATTSRLDLATIEELRAFLFHEQRAARHVGCDFGGPIVEAVATALREKLRDRGPLLECAPHELVADLPNDLPTRCVGAMLDGLVESRHVLAACMRTPALKSAVAASALRGLAASLEDGSPTLRAKAARMFMVVERSDQQRSIEWECISAASPVRDARRVATALRDCASHSRAGVLAFVWSMDALSVLADTATEKVHALCGRRPALESKAVIARPLTFQLLGWSGAES